MSTHKISDLPLAGPITGDELLEIVQSGQNKRVTADQLGGGGSGGGIPDAPSNGKLYGRKNEAWSEVPQTDTYTKVQTDTLLADKAEKNATATTSGGVKIWFDESDDTLCITNNGDDADDI